MPIRTPISEKELVVRLQSGDQAAISILYDNYSPVLYGIILRIIGCEQTAEDVLQDCYVKIWKSISSYDPLKAKLFTWLVRIARNAAIDVVRSIHHRNSQHTCKLNKEGVESSRFFFTFNPDHIALKQTTYVLSSEQMEVIDLLYFAGFTQAEAAAELNIPLGTVKTRARSAIAQLRKAFNTSDDKGN